MLLNYFTIAFRNLLKNKLYTGINVIGLALGIACVSLITIYVKHELGYDKQYPLYENLYRITWVDENSQTRTPHPMAQAMVDDFPEVESAVSLSPLWAAGLTREIYSIRNIEKDIRYDESNFLSVDSTFFDVFQFPVVKGNAREALRNVNGVLISESIAKKYFGNDDPIGKALAVNDDSTLLEVMAVFKDVPEQNHFHFDFLVSYVREKSFDPEDEYYTWADFGHYNYLRLKPGTDAKAFEKKLMPWMRQYIDVSDENFRNITAQQYGFKVQPLTDIHLKSNLRWELESNGNIEYVYIMSAAALLTLVIACINFMNLMTAKSAERAKEIGVRKTLGALRKQLAIQFLSESILTVLVAIMLSLFMVEVSLPFYNAVTGQHFEINYLQVLPILFLVGLIIGIGSGIYPAWVLAGIKPHHILKGKFHTNTEGVRFRNSLIVFQFAISMALISGAAIIYNQLNFIQSKNLGFEKEQVLVVPLKNDEVSPRVQALKAELLKIEGVTAVSASSNMPGGQFNQNSISLVSHPENEIDCSEAFVDYDFQKAMNIELAEGKFFSQEPITRAHVTFVINETAARQLSNESVVGKEIDWHAYEDDAAIKGTIIGVMKDFHYQSFHDPVRPIIFVNYPSYNHLVIKMNTKNLSDKIDQMKKVYAQFDEVFEFNFTFLDDRLIQQYQSEERTGIMFGTFACIAIIIACFGLFGMAMLTFNHRTKEVSIRKILGASVVSLIILLLKDFTWLILVAVVIATPFSWWLMDQWLDNFIYQVGIHPAVFVVSGLILLLIAWITLGYFTFKTSQLNPAQTLKNE